MTRIAAITCVKNEGPFLVEWIAYNRIIGVTDFIFYWNDCTDGTELLLEQLKVHGIVQHRPNPAKGRNYQMGALRDSYNRRLVKLAHWRWIADVDEFLNIHVGNGTIPELIEACGNPMAISIPWQFMANGGVEPFVDEPVIAQFTKTHDPNLWALSGEMEVKTLVHRDFPLDLPRVHRPFVRAGTPEEDVGLWTDASGREVPKRFKMTGADKPIRALRARGSRELATLNHYALRSMESYLVKNRRGDVNREDRAFDTSYWQDRNDPARDDDSILSKLPRLRAEMDRLLALDGVRELHEASVAAHKQSIAEMRAGGEAAELLAAIKGAPSLPRGEAAFLSRLGQSLSAGAS